MEKQRQFYLVLPLLVIPFLTMAFWALGGGKNSGETTTVSRGLDTDLPQAQFRNKETGDKLAIYQAAQRDSTKDGISPAFLNALGMGEGISPDNDSARNTDAQAKQIQQKLAQLHRQIDQPQPGYKPGAYAAAEPVEVRRLNKMMQRVGDSNEDPELNQLDRMLDKIQAIQNPTAVVKDSAHAETAQPFRAIPAMIDGKQRVADGAAVKLKLTDTATIKGQLLQKGQELYGTCQITNQRLLLTILHVRLDNQIIPVNLTVFSEDGMPGIPAPEAELSGVASSNADQALRSMQIMSMDQGIGAQAAAGGINTAKELFSKKVKKIKVKLSDEYPVLLKINQ